MICPAPQCLTWTSTKLGVGPERSPGRWDIPKLSDTLPGCRRHGPARALLEQPVRVAGPYAHRSFASHVPRRDCILLCLRQNQLLEVGQAHVVGPDEAAAAACHVATRGAGVSEGAHPGRVGVAVHLGGRISLARDGLQFVVDNVKPAAGRECPDHHAPFPRILHVQRLHTEARIEVCRGFGWRLCHESSNRALDGFVRHGWGDRQGKSGASLVAGGAARAKHRRLDSCSDGRSPADAWVERANPRLVPRHVSREEGGDDDA
mmetsp:Transcript_1022/g.2903  ORF Transcript_1022/g.2903 Transcript_1022/m.2903 type:complete len:262 (+) Transcript_1022:227-1012(+)